MTTAKIYLLGYNLITWKLLVGGLTFGGGGGGGGAGWDITFLICHVT